MATRSARSRVTAMHCLDLSPGERVWLHPSHLRCFFLLLFNFSRTGPEWQFARSILNLNRFKLQGNIWQSRAEAGRLRCACPRSKGRGKSQRRRADVVVPMALRGGAAAFEPTGD